MGTNREKARKIFKDRPNLDTEPQFERGNIAGRKRNLDGSIPSRPRLRWLPTIVEI